jgi:signal transduction histidine kinase
VAVSLLLAGALTWILFRDLEIQTAQDQLDRQVVSARLVVMRQECLVVPRNPTSTACAGGRLASYGDFVDRLNFVAPQLGTDRLLLLDSGRFVVYDSVRPDVIGTQISITESHRIANVAEARTSLGGTTYILAAAPLPTGRDPVSATYVVLAQPQDQVASAAAGDLAKRLLEAGGAALLVAIVLILIVSYSVSRPLTQLASAAEDITAGNYSRRVNIRGTDEIGLLGSAFNRMAEAVERARKTQRDFLANVSHELKTPLTSLIGFSQALVDGSLTSEGERARAATIIHEESERVLRMAQELLDLARVESGSISIHIAAVDLRSQLEQELEIVRPRADQRKLQLNLQLPDTVPPVAADPERLRQILNNLLDNAVKYAPESSTVEASVRVSLGTVETVIANPAGPLAPDPNRMFERFYRGDPSRSSAAGGVGLGLAISRELAVAMRGRLWADVDPSGVLRVHLMLPQSRDALSRPKSPMPAVA